MSEREFEQRTAAQADSECVAASFLEVDKEALSKTWVDQTKSRNVSYSGFTLTSWMGRLSWSEVRDRAIRFSREWAEAESERSDKQTFWNEFFEVFGVPRRSVATFEASVRKLSGTKGAMDLFWPSKLLIEHKSRGEDLRKAEGQAFDYAAMLAGGERAAEAPRYILISDFEYMTLFDLEPPDSGPLFRDRCSTLHFAVKDLHIHIRAFAFMLGMESIRIDPEDPANNEAFRLMCGLHDELEKGGFSDHHRERLLVRILYCLFADDTGVFAPNAFSSFVDGETREDGSDLGARLNEFFSILDTSPTKRQKHLTPELAALPHVNGQLFAEPLAFARFTAGMRKELLKCTGFNWSKISPAIFGSLFQGILDKVERRTLGAHYTSEPDILKVIGPLFLDDLKAELESIKGDKSTKRSEHLRTFQKRLRSLTFLDPACGCGSFLIVAYRELRLLELDAVVELLDGSSPEPGEMKKLFRVNVDQFFGIECEEWPARIAEVALWLADHQMNVEASSRVGERLERLPLESAPNITIGNALRTSWSSVVPPEKCSYVLGNPPYAGKKEQTATQKADVARVWNGIQGCGNLDYVTCWFRLAIDYVRGTKTRVAFVSTNSIAQGEQVGVLWTELLSRGATIHFAHTTFAWRSEARGKAHVHVVIVGFGSFESESKKIFNYQSAKSTPCPSIATNINPYLVDAPNVVVRTRKTSINGDLRLNYGSMMIDKPRKTEEGADRYDRGLIIGGDEAREALLLEDSNLDPYIRRCYGGDEYINGETRWCLWLVDAPPEIVKNNPSVRKRVEGVKKFRLSSPRLQTQRLASTPSLFGERRQPTSRYILIPKVSSESRRYIPIGFLEPDVIATGSALVLPDATLYEFGVLSSSMHNAWMRTVGGRMKSDYQYSSEVVYNNFTWPDQVSPIRREVVENAAQAVIDVRNKYNSSTLATLYDPVTMPPDLAKAHEKLDLAVDACYRQVRFSFDSERVSLLFSLYEKLTRASSQDEHIEEEKRPKPPRKAKPAMADSVAKVRKPRRQA